MPKELTIDSLAYGGSGIGRLNGKVVFVPLTAPGDVVSFRDVREKKGYIEGEIVDILQASPLRREPPCHVFGDCGGCSWQHLPYEEQAGAKEEIFRETLWRLGTVEKENILPIIAAPSELNYRNRAQFKVRYVEDRLHIGFYRKKSHFVIDIESCPIMSPLINNTINRLRDALKEAPFKGEMPQIDISVNDNDSEAVVIIHLTGRPSADDINFAKNKLSDIQGLKALFFKSGRGNALTKIFAEEKGRLKYRLKIKDEEIKLAFSPGGFTQVNYPQNRELVSAALDIASRERVKKALDLYCGMGNFSIPLSLIADEVTGIEDFDGAIRDAKYNAEALGMGNCRFIAGDALRELNKIDLRGFDLALIDPPRQGAASVVKKLVEAGIPRMIYVSCNPTTLARDLRIMTRKGYRVASSQPFDLFPQTWHIESVTLIEKLA